MKNNYITKTAGRGPALSGATLLHAVNNVWDDVKGHVIEGGDTKARGIFEGNVFKDVRTVVADYSGRLFGSPDATTNGQCNTALGRACQVNLAQGTTTTMNVLTQRKDTSFFGEFSGKNVAGAVEASGVASRIPRGAGTGKIPGLSARSISMRFRD